MLPISLICAVLLRCDWGDFGSERPYHSYMIQNPASPVPEDGAPELHPVPESELPSLYASDEHLAAIVGMLNALHIWRSSLRQRVSVTGDEDAMYAFVFADIAYAQAAIGAIAPMFESIFCNELAKLKPFFPMPSECDRHHRWGLNRISFGIQRYLLTSTASQKGRMM